MNKTILIYVVLLTIYSYDATNSSEPNVKCETSYVAPNPRDFVCGSDGQDYLDRYDFECKQKTKYGKSVNLQLWHRGGCWIWEKHGFETSEVIWVSEFEVDFIHRISLTCVFNLLQIPLIIFAPIFGVFLYFIFCICWEYKLYKKGFYALKHFSQNSPVDEKIIKVKINSHVETKDGRTTFHHDPIIIDNVELVLIAAATTITIDE